MSAQQGGRLIAMNCSGETAQAQSLFQTLKRRLKLRALDDDELLKLLKKHVAILSFKMTMSLE